MVTLLHQGTVLQQSVQGLALGQVQIQAGQVGLDF